MERFVVAVLTVALCFLGTLCGLYPDESLAQLLVALKLAEAHQTAIYVAVGTFLGTVALGKYCGKTFREAVKTAVLTTPPAAKTEHPVVLKAQAAVLEKQLEENLKSLLERTKHLPEELREAEGDFRCAVRELADAQKSADAWTRMRDEASERHASVSLEMGKSAADAAAIRRELDRLASET